MKMIYLKPSLTRVLAALCLATLIGSPASAQETFNLTTKNTWLTDSVFPTSHHNPAQTDVSPIAGLPKGQALTADDVKTANAVFVSNPTMKRIGDDRIVFVSGVNGEGIAQSESTEREI